MYDNMKSQFFRENVFIPKTFFQQEKKLFRYYYIRTKFQISFNFRVVELPLLVNCCIVSHQVIG